MWVRKQSLFKLVIQEARSKNTPEPCSSNEKGPIYEERRLQVGDKVLLDVANSRIATSESNGEIPLTELSIFPYGIVEVIHSKFGFLEPHDQAHGRASGRAHTIEGNTTV
ncbi:hypothetical protein GOBAR_AA04451 [Gossypium barbadense]|uniref:Uncharacterized protein n=1 Tax=Gossypium barbadense TaxID=3634 RepID=A0A2P5YKL1_GOSBA|nr:hypothetical protein GOBAR_AA04451 [Gossypium barbadense]